MNNIYTKQIPNLVIYHGGCPDGIAGAWSIKYHINSPDTTYHPGSFNKPAPDVKDQNVLFVDFTYTKDVMLDIIKSAKTVRVLDHHKSANFIKEFNYDNFSYVLDMYRSGAQIAWDEMTDEERPWFIDDIADRDLWQWKREDSKNTTKAIFSLGYYESIDKFSTINLIKKNDDEYKNILNIGKILNDDNELNISIICKYAIDCYCVSLKNPSKKWKCKVVECDFSKKSDVGNRLSSDDSCDFAAMFNYNILSNEWWISLRASDKSDIDLTEVVKHFDRGGGHPKAAGFTIYGNNGHTLRTVFQPITNN